MKIRTGKLNDIKKYTDLLQTTYESAYVNNKLGLTKECFSKEVFASGDTQRYVKSHLLNNKTQKTWLAFEREKLVGSITCVIQNEREAELTGFYVHPDFQGRGIGKKLYNLALKFAGNRDLMLDIYAHNTKTIDTYKRWGWKLDTSRGNKGYFSRHWTDWPKGLKAKSMYMRLRRES
jgi:ribosomal protein S18 acetylase RimI-like enzyme